MENSGNKAIEKHDTVFASPLALFNGWPYNDTFTEVRKDMVNASPVDRFAEVVTFTRHGNNVGVIKSSEEKLLADLSMRRADGTLSIATASVTAVPLLCERCGKRLN